MSVVVIVDDRATNLKILRRFAERLGPNVSVHTYDNAETALAELPGLGPDLIVTDYVMPRMSGEEFIQECRLQPATGEVPIIVVTAFEDKEFRYRALDSGASDFLLSPVDAREFQIRARNLLTIREQHKRLQSRAVILESELETKRRQYADEILQREQQLRRIVDTVPALIRANRPDQSVTLANTYHQTLLRPNGHTGVDPAQKSPQCDDYGERHRALDRKVAETARMLRNVEEVVVDSTGAERVLLTTKAPVESASGHVDQIVTVSLDITERKRNEQALRESEQRFRSLVESSVLGIVIDRDGRPLFANRTFAEIFGYPSPADVVALDSLDALFAPEDLPRFHHLHGAWSRGDPAPTRYECRGRRCDGSLIWVEAQVQDVFWGGQRAIQSTVADITLRKEYEQRLQRQANYDEITGLPNRILALDRLRSAVLSALRHHHKVALLFLDLDHFKRINDTLGHATGDQLLRMASERLSKSVRAEDTVARLGGDEFTVILPKLGEPDHAEPVIQKILETFSSPFLLGQEEAFVTTSIGVTIAPDDGTEPDVLMQNADAAMYRAKEHGRNTFHFFTPELNQRALERMRIESHLLHALSRNELSLHYQPIVHLATGAVVGAEALLRWSNATLGDIEPERFVPLAEDTGLIVPIGRWVLDSACQQLSDWRQNGLPPLRISVNISSRQFRGANLGRTMADVLNKHGIKPEDLELEITERLLMDELPHTQANLRELASLSVRLSLDDFGTGYSNLRYLQQFPVDTLKVDKSFVSEVSNSNGNATVVEAIIAMAHRLGLQVVGEGIETLEQLEFLRHHGCDLAQGFYFSHPLPPAEFAAWVRSRPPRIRPVSLSVL